MTTTLSEFLSYYAKLSIPKINNFLAHIPRRMSSNVDVVHPNAVAFWDLVQEKRNKGQRSGIPKLIATSHQNTAQRNILNRLWQSERLEVKSTSPLRVLTRNGRSSSPASKRQFRKHAPPPPNQLRHERRNPLQSRGRPKRQPRPRK